MDAAGVPAEWVEATAAHRGQGTLVSFHGGYVGGSLANSRPLAANLAVATGARVLSVGYRLVPEHPYPAAIEDGLTAYAWLLEEGLEVRTAAFIGDSTGGGLLVAVLLAARDRGLSLPTAGVCLSPCLDLVASPVFADLTGLPPLLIQTPPGAHLHSDAVRLADFAQRAGVPVTLQDATTTIERIAGWLAARWANA